MRHVAVPGAEGAVRVVLKFVHKNLFTEIEAILSEVKPTTEPQAGKESVKRKTKHLPKPHTEGIFFLVWGPITRRKLFATFV